MRILVISVISMMLILGCEKEEPLVNPELVVREAIRFIGTTVRTTNQDEMNEKTAKIPGNWNSFFSASIANKIPNKSSEDMFGVYSQYETDASGPYNLTVALQVEPNTIAPNSLESIDAKASRYLKFTARGEMPAAVIDMWQQIWQYFASDSHGYSRAYTVDFEHYDNRTPDKVDVFISIK